MPKKKGKQLVSLTPKQSAFIEAYFGEAKCVIAEAARIVGLRPDYARHMVTKTHVFNAMEERAAELAKTERIGCDAVRLELARCGFYDIKDFVTATGDVKPIEDIPLDARRAIIGMKVTRRKVRGENGYDEVVTELKLAPKTPNLELLGKYYGMWNKDKKPKAQPPPINFYMDGKKI